MQTNINWFESRVNLTPSDVALIDSETDQPWTYQELNERAELLAAHLVSEGVQKGDRIALLAPNHISHFDFIIASMKVGSIFVPLNYRLAHPELMYIIKDCDPKILGVTPSIKSELELEEIDIHILDIKDNKYLDSFDGGNLSVSQNILEDDPLAMIYTGGTTGRPKGVVLSHRSILWNAINTIITWDLGKEDITLTTLPMFHTGGLNVFSLPLLLVGGKLVITAEFQPEKAVKDLIGYKCTTALFVPTMYHMMVETEVFRKSDFPDLKVLVSGGAPCPQNIYEAFKTKGIAFKEGYGLTEAGPNNFYIHPDDTVEKAGSVGKPMLFNDIQIVDGDGNEVEADEVGELLIYGPHSFEFYWNKPDETEKTLVDGWVHTGDLARSDADGYVYIAGRKKDLIITGGENVYPLEIENCLESHEAIDEAAVIGVPDEKWGEKVIAFIVGEGNIQQEELKDYCKGDLSDYKVPKSFHFLDELPKTNVGKIDKKELGKLYRE